MTRTRKIIIAVLAAAAGACGAMWAIGPHLSAAHAQTAPSGSLEAQLQALEVQIAELEHEIMFGASAPGYLPTGTGTGTGTASGGSAVLLDIESNPAVGAVYITPGGADQRIASFIVTNASGAAVTLPGANGISIDPGASANIYLNLRVDVNGSLYGAQAGVANGTTYAIPGTSPLTIPAGGQAVIDVYADVSATAPLGTANAASLLLYVPGETSTSAVPGETATVALTTSTSTVSGPVISSISPAEGGTGTSITLTGTDLDASTTILMDGEFAAQTADVLNSSTITFIVPIALTPDCATTASSTIACNGVAHLEGPGAYTVTAVTDGIPSNGVSFQLTGNPYYHQP